MKKKTCLFGSTIIVISAVVLVALFFFSDKKMIAGKLYKEIDQGANVTYVSNSNLREPYTRQALDDVLSIPRNYSEVISIFGAPTIICCSKSKKSLPALDGFVVYRYKDKYRDANSKQLYGRGILIEFTSGVAVSWDIIDNGITIRPYDFSEIQKILHIGMTIKDIEKIFGSPTEISRDNGEISSYIYSFSGDYGSFMGMQLVKDLIIWFEDGECRNFSITTDPAPYHFD